MKELQIDLTPFEDKAGIHSFLKKSLGFPDYYGANLDALYDELSSIGDPIKLTVFYPEEAKNELKGFYPKLIGVFRDAAQFNEKLTVEFIEKKSTPKLKQEFGLTDIYDFLKRAKTYYLATVEKNAQPRVRPFGTVNLFEGKLYIQTGKIKAVSKQLHENPLAELCAFQDGSWLRVSGELIPDERFEAKKNMLDAYPELKGMYSPEDDNTEVLYFQNAHAVLSSFTEPARELYF